MIISQKSLPILILFLGILFILLSNKLAYPPEIKQIKSTEDLESQVELYKTLIKRIGPEQAQEALQKSGLPFDGQAHLLNHSVGEYLYEEYGPGGLSHCHDYFAASCYHGFLIQAISEGGPEKLSKVMDECSKKGEFVEGHCSHAIGHGLLAWVGYKNLLKALKQCDDMVDIYKNFPTYSCYTGVFMENIWALHENGRASPDRWIKDSDPSYPCNEPKIDEKYIEACWSSQPMRTYQVFKGDLKKSGEKCFTLSTLEYRAACFEGLARQIHPLSKGNIKEIFRLCSLMPENWISMCIISVARSSFNGGNRSIPYKLCEQIRKEDKTMCYKSLSQVIVYHYPENNLLREKLCNKIPNHSLRQYCNDQ